jgi:hypothetical protein
MVIATGVDRWHWPPPAPIPSPVAPPPAPPPWVDCMDVLLDSRETGGPAGAKAGCADCDCSNQAPTVLRPCLLPTPLPLCSRHIFVHRRIPAQRSTLHTRAPQDAPLSLPPAQDLTGLNLQEASFVRCSFKGAKLRSVNLKRSLFIDCDFTGADLSQAHTRP